MSLHGPFYDMVLSFKNFSTMQPGERSVPLSSDKSPNFIKSS